jgi:hypothetical protein
VVKSPVRCHVGLQRTGGIEAALGAAPRSHVLSTLSREPAEDRLAHAAFGRRGESAAARTIAAHLVRRYQIASASRGYRLLCYCRPEADRPQVLMPGAEAHSQRPLSTRGLHTSACEAIQEPDVQRNWAPTAPRPCRPLSGTGWLLESRHKCRRPSVVNRACKPEWAAQVIVVVWLLEACESEGTRQIEGRRNSTERAIGGDSVRGGDGSTGSVLWHGFRPLQAGWIRLLGCPRHPRYVLRTSCWNVPGCCCAHATTGCATQSTGTTRQDQHRTVGEHEASEGCDPETG